MLGKSAKQILVAIAWPYVNGDQHLGHMSGYLLPADIFARYHRLKGNDVLMVSGSDCHGTPITVEADKRGSTPEEIVEEYHHKDVNLFRELKLSYNLYTKTTTKNHKKVVQDLFIDLLKNDYIVKDTMQQYYSPEDNTFLPDRYVEGECSYCGAKEQRSDQCENCGRWLKDGELVNPYSKLTNKPVQLKETEHYFLDFEKLQKPLEKYVKTKKDIWRKWVYAEANGWLKESLQKRAITRDMDWSMDLPIDRIQKLNESKHLQDYTGKKIYVWFEAVIGYLSAPQEWVEYALGTPDLTEVIYHKDTNQSNDWKDWWLNKNSEHYYFMGQDNLVFHTLMWPGQLIGSGKNYTLPHNVFVNKFMNYEGKKFSKSRKWTIDPLKMAQNYGNDSLRYFIASNLPENKEANFSWELFVDAINNELVANLGNFINRTLKFLESKFDGTLNIKEKINFTVINKTKQAYTQIGTLIEKGEFVSGLAHIMKYATFGNQYFNDTEIWKVIKTDKNQASIIMGNLLYIVDNLRILIAPYLPEAHQKLNNLLWDDNNIKKENITWMPINNNIFKLLDTVEVLFDKLDKEEVLIKKDN